VENVLWTSQAIELFRAHWPYYVSWGILYTLIIAITIWVPFIPLVIPLSAGLWYATFNLIRTTGSSKLEIKEFLQGFKWILPVIMISLIEIICVGVGLVLFIIPGIYLLVCLQFALILFMEYYKEEVHPMDALRISLVVSRKKFFPLLGFLCLNSLLCMSGLLLFGIGLVVTIPVAHIAQCYAVRDIFGLRDHHRYSIDHNLP